MTIVYMMSIGLIFLQYEAFRRAIVCVCVCVSACVRACVRACVCVCYQVATPTFVTTELLSVDISACSSSRKDQEKQEHMHRVQNALVSSKGVGEREGREREKRGEGEREESGGEGEREESGGEGEGEERGGRGRGTVRRRGGRGRRKRRGKGGRKAVLIQTQRRGSGNILTKFLGLLVSS